jgi:hypothetical protein
VAKLKQELQIKATEEFILRRRHSDNLVDVERLREVWILFLWRSRVDNYILNRFTNSSKEGRGQGRAHQ